MSPPAADSAISRSCPLYNVLLVEDEVAIREGIRDIISWAELGFHFSGEAKNGVEALELVNRLKPDLMITDIRMPLMDGLELIEKVRQENHEIKIVVLSGFDEFSYAQKTLRLEVRDYLLKPVSPSEITELLKRIKNELDTRKSLSERARLSGSLIRQMAVFKLISGDDFSDFLEKNLPDEPVLTESGEYVAAVYDYDEEHSSINPDDFRDIIEGRNRPGITSFLVLDSAGVLVEIISASGDQQSWKSLRSITEAKRRIIEERSGNLLSAGVGSVETSLKGIRDSYLTARGSLSQRFVNGGSTVYLPGDNVCKNPPTRDKSIILQINNAIESGSFSELTSHFDTLIENLKSVKAAEQQCRDEMNLVISAMLHGINSKKSNPETSSLLNSSMLTKAAKFKTITGLRRWFLEIVGLVQEEILEEREDSYLLMAERARSYIDKHFSDTSLSLETVCSHLGTSLSTFSRVFKAYNDTTFSAYLTEVRIHQAKILMSRADLRNKEIAFQVGFRSPHYFSHVFTKQMGYSPSAYRKALRLEAAHRNEVK